MAFKVSENDTEEMAEINIIPLVDVMLVLLIIFMVTAPLSIGGINVALPNSKAKSVSVDQDRIVLTIDQDGAFFLDKVQIKAVDLEAKLRAIYELREKKDLYIRADKSVKYGKVVDAMSAAKIAGVQKMSMLTQHVQQLQKK